MRQVSFLLPLLLCLLFIFPVTTHAATSSFFGPIISENCHCDHVPDGQGGFVESAPDFGCVLQTVQNLINFSISIGVIFATLALMYAGALWVLSPFNPANREKGRTMLLNVVVGLIIVLSAWLLIDFVMKVFYNPTVAGEDGKAFGPWNTIISGGSQCLLVKAPPPSKTKPDTTSGPIASVPSTPGTPVTPATPATSNPPATPVKPTSPATPPTAANPPRDLPNSCRQTICDNCIKLAPLGLTCKTAGSCNLSQPIASKVSSLENSFTGSWRVTEGYPPTTCAHTNACHYNGTCIDAGFVGTTYTASSVSTFAAAAKAAGLRPVFETGDCSLRNAARAAGVTAYCSSDRGYGHITGSHFSLYGN